MNLAHGEVVKRRYPVGEVKRAFGWQKGQLVVTDSRVLYRARAKSFLGESFIAREIQVADVSGAGLVTRRGMSLAGALAILLGFLLGLLVIGLIDAGARTAASFGVRASSGPSGIAVFLFFLLTIITVTLIILRLREVQVLFAVYARDVTSSPITLSGTLGRDSAGLFTVLVANTGGPLIALGRALGFLDATDASYSADITETTALYEDFGGLILDLQSRGVLGAE